MTLHMLGPLQSHGRPNGVPGSWLQLSPTSAVADTEPALPELYRTTEWS